MQCRCAASLRECVQEPRSNDSVVVTLQPSRARRPTADAAAPTTRSFCCCAAASQGSTNRHRTNPKESPSMRALGSNTRRGLRQRRTTFLRPVARSRRLGRPPAQCRASGRGCPPATHAPSQPSDVPGSPASRASLETDLRARDVQGRPNVRENPPAPLTKRVTPSTESGQVFRLLCDPFTSTGE